MTNPERFQPLHDIARDMLQRLEATYEVVRSDAPPDAELERAPLARPGIMLTPADPGAAPIIVAFTTFPGLMVRCGRWLVEAFPVCGCDACASTLDDETHRFRELVDHVVRGELSERIVMPFLRQPRREHSFGARGSGWTRLDRSEARELVGEGPHSFQWAPWPTRQQQADN